MLFQSFIFVLMISLSICLPQLNDRPYSYWKNRPRSISMNAYYSNHPATYQDPQEVKRPDGQEFVRQDSKVRGPIAKTDDVKEVRIMNHASERVSMDSSMYNDQNSDFVFPGYVNHRRSSSTTDTPAHIENPYLPDPKFISENCATGFCESADYYPSDYIHNRVEENPDNYKDLFGKDEIIPVNISTRIGVADGDGTPMCSADERIIQPPIGQNANDEWKFIVNSEKYVQGIRVEICRETGNECAMSQNFPLSYETECKQKYIFRKLLALDASGNVVTDNFRLPSCCLCVYRAKRISRSIFGVK